MTPIDQTTFGFPGGNCFSACVATILDVPLEDVPYFMTGDDWWLHFEAWCAVRGLKPLYRPQYPPPSYLQRRDLFRHYILGGKSPRCPKGDHHLHAVVAFDTEIVHDPHPSRKGLLTREDCIFLQKI